MIPSDHTPGAHTVHRFGESFAGSAPENYQRYFVPAIAEPVAGILMRHAALAPGERVLDVACGTGVVARLAAERVGASGYVAGVDVNPGMLAVAQAVTTPNAPIAWHQANAEALPLPDESFDVVLCQMSLQFVEDKVSALQEMRRVLVPGGRLLINVPGRVSPLFRILADALGTHIDPSLAGFILHVFALWDPGELEHLMKEAGLRDVSARSSLYPTLRLPSPRDFLWQYVYSTPLSGAIARADAARRTALERDIIARWEDFTEDGMMTYRQEMVDASACR